MADILVEIPQVGKVRSLNVHVSMVICFWEYLKQKEKKQSNQSKLENGKGTNYKSLSKEGKQKIGETKLSLPN